MNNEIPALSEKTLEALIIAVLNLETANGLRIQLPLEWVLTPAIMQQLPSLEKKF